MEPQTKKKIPKKPKRDLNFNNYLNQYADVYETHKKKTASALRIRKVPNKISKIPAEKNRNSSKNTDKTKVSDDSFTTSTSKKTSLKGKDDFIDSFLNSEDAIDENEEFSKSTSSPLSLFGAKYLKNELNIGKKDYSKTTKIELKVNLARETLNEIGSLLPNLRHLKLNSSLLPTISNLGTNLLNLRVLWAS